MAQDKNESRRYWRSRRGWITAHVFGGIAAGVIGFGALVAIAFALVAMPGASIDGLALSSMAVVVLIALAPLIAYQSWALRRAIAPWAWGLAWIAAILSTPLIAVLFRRAATSEGGSGSDLISWMAAALLAGLCGALAQWVAVRHRVDFPRWLAGAGTGLTLLGWAIVLGLAAGLLIGLIVTVPLALAAYGALTWRSLRPLITDS